MNATTCARENPVASRTSLCLIAAATGLLQLVLVAASFPLSAMGTDASLWYIDHPYHLYQIEAGRAFLAHHALSGYDPFFGAGNVGGVSFNASARIPVLLSLLVPASVSSATLYACYVFFCAITAPATAVWFAAMRRWSATQAAFAGAVALVFWWCGAFHWYHTAGLVSFVLCCYFGIAYAAWIWSLCREEGRSRPVAIVLAGLVGGMGCWLHPLFAVVVVLVFGAFLIVERPNPSAVVVVARGGAIAVLAVVCNLPWIIAMMHVPGIVTEQPFQRSVGLSVITSPLLGLWSGMGMKLNPVCAAVVLVALLSRYRPQRATLVSAALASLAMLLFAAFGAALAPLGALQPNRFVAPAFLLLGLASAAVVGERVPRLWRDRSRPVSIFFFVALVGVAGYAGVEVAREVGSGPQGHYGKRPPEMTEAPAIVDQLADWIRSNTTRDGRILMESSLGRVYGGGHVVGMLSRLTDREFMGGSYPFTQSRQSFWDRVGFGKPLTDLPVDEFAAGLELYNVGWIVAHSPALQRYVAASNQADVAAQFGDVVIFRLRRRLSFVEEGHARIAARTFDRLDVADATGEPLVLRYNWVPGLKVTAPARIEPAQVRPDFPPLIRVVGAPPRFSISLCSACVEPR